MKSSDLALLHLGRILKSRNYRFIAVTPATHARINARRENSCAERLEDVFGWNRSFRPDLLPDEMIALLEEADAIEVHGNLLRSRVRFATLGDMIFLHSEFPTSAADAVFFGPDTYRFARELRRATPPQDARVVDVGAGGGAGGLFLQRRAEGRLDLVLGDVNPLALRYAEINAALNECRDVRFVKSDILDGIDGEADLIVANPPFMIDPLSRMYRDGGEGGIAIAVRIVRDAVPRLSDGGTLLVYTGVPIKDGRDGFRDAVAPFIADLNLNVVYEEIDPDIFGEELDEPAYAGFERIAAVSLTVNKRPSQRKVNYA